MGKNADFTQVNAPNASSAEANGLVADGKLWIGSTATNAGGTHINVGTLTSPDNSITVGYSSPNITLQVSAAGGDVSGPGSSTDRAIATWNGTAGTDLFNNSTTNIDSTGRFTNTAQPAFLARLTGLHLNATGDGTVYQLPFNSVIFDQGSNFTTGASAHYTFPVTGKYLISASVSILPDASSNTAQLSIVATSRSITYGQTWTGAAGLVFTPSTSVLIDATAGDTVAITIAVFGGTLTTTVNGNTSATFISGYLVC